MIALPQKVKAVKEVYHALDAEIAGFQNRTGLHCLSGCGECCKKPDIEATPLEFLPLALQLFDEGKAEEMRVFLLENEDPICIAFRPHVTNFGGLCNQYPNRGMICRLFGFTARRDKEGKPDLVTCKFIKEEQADLYQAAMKDIHAGADVPLMTNYYSQLQAINMELTSFFPINKAILKAIESVLHYYAYRERDPLKELEEE